MKKFIIYNFIILYFLYKLFFCPQISFAGNVSTLPQGLSSYTACFACTHIVPTADVEYYSEGDLNTLVNAWQSGSFTDYQLLSWQIPSLSTYSQVVLYYWHLNSSYQVDRIYLNQDFFNPSIPVSTSNGLPANYMDILNRFYLTGSDGSAGTDGMDVTQYSFIIAMIGIVSGLVFCMGLKQ